MRHRLVGPGLATLCAATALLAGCAERSPVARVASCKGLLDLKVYSQQEIPKTVQIFGLDRAPGITMQPDGSADATGENGRWAPLGDGELVRRHCRDVIVERKVTRARAAELREELAHFAL
jgi:hypothetical protein